MAHGWTTHGLVLSVALLASWRGTFDGAAATQCFANNNGAFALTCAVSAFRVPQSVYDYCRSGEAPAGAIQIRPCTAKYWWRMRLRSNIFAPAHGGARRLIIAARGTATHAPMRSPCRRAGPRVSCRSQWGENQLGSNSVANCRLIAAHVSEVLNLPRDIGCEPYKYMGEGWASSTFWIDGLFSHTASAPSIANSVESKLEAAGVGNIEFRDTQKVNGRRPSMMYVPRSVSCTPVSDNWNAIWAKEHGEACTPGKFGAMCLGGFCAPPQGGATLSYCDDCYGHGKHTGDASRPCECDKGYIGASCKDCALTYTWNEDKCQCDRKSTILRHCSCVRPIFFCPPACDQGARSPLAACARTCDHDCA